MLTKISIPFIILYTLFLSACNNRPELNVVEQHFFQHQSEFEAIVDSACAIRSRLDVRWLRYEIHQSHQYDDSIRSELQQLDRLMAATKSPRIIIMQEGETECSLYVGYWSAGFAGSGATLGFSFQPAEVYEYHPNLFNTKGTVETERGEIRFTKPLASDWYLSYHKWG